MVPFCPVPFCPTMPFCPNIPCSILPPSLRLEKSHYLNYNIARCSIKRCENANNRYIIIFNHMQRLYYLICQRTWCQNASKLISQKGEISFLWDTKNVIYCKFNFHAWRWTGRWQKSSGLENRPTPGMAFPKHPGFHFAPHVPFCPDLLYSWHIFLGYLNGDFWAVVYRPRFTLPPNPNTRVQSSISCFTVGWYVKHQFQMWKTLQYIHNICKHFILVVAIKWYQFPMGRAFEIYKPAH